MSEETIERTNLLEMAGILQSISDHAEGILGRSESGFHFSLCDKGDESIYRRRKVKGIPGCDKLLIFDSMFAGWVLYYHLGEDIYLRVNRA